MSKIYRVKITKPTLEFKQSLELNQIFSMQNIKEGYYTLSHEINSLYKTSFINDKMQKCERLFLESEILQGFSLVHGVKIEILED